MPVAQAALAVAILLLATLLPRAGQPVLLLPLGHQDAASFKALSAKGLALVGPGRWPHTLVVYHTEKFPTLAVLRLGFLPLAAPAGLCGQPSDVGLSALNPARSFNWTRQ
ncbi:MAG: hypothetical protein B7Z34_12475 [Novosphingobium sp. 12-62-10]|nr:MAG: hypothetical protein B7Z34_12475 [Novosphingobium sp. 12-62-10]OZA35863.1 MAG: hypothetical protein B7X92_08700 [Novosphingobium sp. 17-62-9]